MTELSRFLCLLASCEQDGGVDGTAVIGLGLDYLKMDLKCVT